VVNLMEGLAVFAKAAAKELTARSYFNPMLTL
jgi:hypothetical protein